MIPSKNKIASSDDLYNALQSDICKGRIGSRLPSIAQLCDIYDVSHCTVKKVLDRLKSHKYIEGYKGKCVLVNETAIANPLFRKNIVFYLHIDTMGNPYYLKILACVRQLLHDSGSLVHFVNSSEQLAGLDLKPDVIVLSEILDKNEVEELETVCGWENVLKLNDSSQNYNTIATDNYDGGYQAAEYLYKMGHRNVGLVSRDLGIANDFFANRFHGFKAFVETHSHMSFFNAEINMAENLNVVVPAATKELLAKCPQITAFFAITDMLAMGVYSYCAQNGLKIPQDVSVLSFDNRDFSSMLFPPLTTFQEDSEQVAALVKEMIGKIVGKHEPQYTILIKPFLIERESVGKIH